jgi:hypothetical protein
MNPIKGILVAFVLLSGAIFAPIPSFAQSTDDTDLFSYIYEILRQLFSSGDIEIITDGSSIQDFNKATIILTSSTTTTGPGDGDTGDDDDDGDGRGDDDDDGDGRGDDDDDGEDIDDFNKATIILTSSTTTTGPTKVVLCHIPPGNPSNAHTISVGGHAKDAHLAHGDELGECLPSISEGDNSINSQSLTDDKGKSDN